MARTFSRTITTPAAARMVRPASRPVVSFVTDFGSRDPSAGIMRAVVLGIAPDALIIDISHEVEKYRVRDAALLLWCAVPYLPHGAHVAVVDPGVGTPRRAVALETARGDFLVGPDNGVLLPAATRLGGILRVHQLSSPQYRLPVISSSFHGRDLFAPAAAHLAMGLPLEFLGPGVDPRQLVLLDWPEPQVFAGVLRSQVIYLDTFGNVKLSALSPDLGAALGALRYGERLWLRLTDLYGSNDVEVTWVETFGQVPVGQPLLYEDSYGRLSVAINQGSAATAIGIREDAEVLVTRQQLPRADGALPEDVPGSASEAAWGPVTARPTDAWSPEEVPMAAWIAGQGSVEGWSEAPGGEALMPEPVQPGAWVEVPNGEGPSGGLAGPAAADGQPVGAWAAVEGGAAGWSGSPGGVPGPTAPQGDGAWAGPAGMAGPAQGDGAWAGPAQGDGAWPGPAGPPQGDGAWARPPQGDGAWPGPAGPPQGDGAWPPQGGDGWPAAGGWSTPTSPDAWPRGQQDGWSAPGAGVSEAAPADPAVPRASPQERRGRRWRR
jgi:hypothetical protein